MTILTKLMINEVEPATVFDEVVLETIDDLDAVAGGIRPALQAMTN
jgi:hypothetical protein